MLAVGVLFTLFLQCSFVYRDSYCLYHVYMLSWGVPSRALGWEGGALMYS